MTSNSVQSTTDQLLCYRCLAKYSSMFCWRGYNSLISSYPAIMHGFTAGRSTTDAVLPAELHRELSRPLNVAYLGIKTSHCALEGHPQQMCTRNPCSSNYCPSWTHRHTLWGWSKTITETSPLHLVSDSSSDGVEAVFLRQTFAKTRMSRHETSQDT